MGSQTLQPGSVIADRYQIVSVLGSGAMGTVYRAVHLVLGSTAAIKVIDADVLDASKASERAELEARFLREAKIAATLNSPNIVRVLDFGTSGGLTFMAMELLEGEDLETRLDRTGPIAVAEALSILLPIAKALARGHALGIVHRDLKPANIFLASVDGDLVPKILDFGIAKLAAQSTAESLRLTKDGGLLGTPCYMSPEQITGRPTVGPSGDCWAFAVTAFEMLTGRLPWNATQMGELVLEVCTAKPPAPSQFGPFSPALDRWWETATNRVESARFATITESAAALQRALTEPSAAGASISIGKTSHGAARPVDVAPHRGSWLYGVALAMIAVGILAGVGMFNALKKDPPRGAVSENASGGTSTSGAEEPPNTEATTTIVVAPTTPPATAQMVASNAPSDLTVSPGVSATPSATQAVGAVTTSARPKATGSVKTPATASGKPTDSRLE